jgi:hypothetical protein
MCSQQARQLIIRRVVLYSFIELAPPNIIRQEEAIKPLVDDYLFI